MTALESREPAAANSGLDQAAGNRLGTATVAAATPNDPLTEAGARQLTTKIQLRLTTIAGNVESYVSAMGDLHRAVQRLEALHRDDRFAHHQRDLRSHGQPLDGIGSRIDTIRAAVTSGWSA